jgi:hypothetical protein
MKYSIPVALVLFCALSATARAQEASADVLANVTQDLVLTSEGKTNFGSVGNFGHTERIDPKAPIATQSTAQFTLSASGDFAVFVTCPSEVTLTEPVSSAVMTFTPELSFNGPPYDQSTSFPFTCNQSLGTSGINELWLWLGGSLLVPMNQVPGSYSGVFTLSMARM